MKIEGVTLIDHTYSTYQKKPCQLVLSSSAEAVIVSLYNGRGVHNVPWHYTLSYGEHYTPYTVARDGNYFTELQFFVKGRQDTR